MRNVLSKEVVKKIRAYILCSITFLTVVPVFKIMLENIVEQGPPHMTI
jgi:hypothetical protein